MGRPGNRGDAGATGKQVSLCLLIISTNTARKVHDFVKKKRRLKNTVYRVILMVIDFC